MFLVGAGKMSELAARHLVQQGAGAILVTNRTLERARQLAEPSTAASSPSNKLYETASEADIVISSTGAPHPIFRREHGQHFMHRRRNRPMFFIDIAVPRDVDPAMNKIEGIFVYDIDDLQQVAASHIAERRPRGRRRRSPDRAEVERFHQRRRAVNVAPAIVSLQHQAEEIASSRDQAHASASRLAHGRATRRSRSAHPRPGQQVFHPPMQALKQAARENDSARVEALCETWSLPSVPNRPTRPKSPKSPPRRRSEEPTTDRDSETSAVGGK